MTPAELRARAVAALTAAMGGPAAHQALATLEVHGLVLAERAGHAAVVGDRPLRTRLGAELNGGGAS